MLHGHAVQGPEAEHQVAGIDSDHFAAGEELGQGVQCHAVHGVVEDWNKNQPVGDIEIGVTSGQPLAGEPDWGGHGERHDPQAGALEDSQVFAQGFVVGF